jgi:hypothetical protein
LIPNASLKDPYVTVTILPIGSTKRTKPAIGGGTSPAWTTVGHDAHFYFDIDMGIQHTIMLEVR